jgi:hypothetical protein
MLKISDAKPLPPKSKRRRIENSAESPEHRKPAQMPLQMDFSQMIATAKGNGSDEQKALRIATLFMAGEELESNPLNKTLDDEDVSN